MHTHRFFSILFILALGFIPMGYANVSAEIREGQDYYVLSDSQPVREGNSIEVIEFFWYGCPHCYHLNPYIKTWLENPPEDVKFRYVPAILQSGWVHGAKLFYALDAIKETGRLHDKVYDAIHRDNINLTNDSVLFDWVTVLGIDTDRFTQSFRSFEIQNMVARSTLMSRQYQLTGVPTLVIDGRYVTSGRKGGSSEDAIMVIEQLLEKVRRERAEQ